MDSERPSYITHLVIFALTLLDGADEAIGGIGHSGAIGDMGDIEVIGGIGGIGAFGVKTHRHEMISVADEVGGVEVV